jgi:hypothetical protein
MEPAGPPFAYECLTVHLRTPESKPNTPYCKGEDRSEDKPFDFSIFVWFLFGRTSATIMAYEKYQVQIPSLGTE